MNRASDSGARSAWLGWVWTRAATSVFQERLGLPVPWNSLWWWHARGGDTRRLLRRIVHASNSKPFLSFSCDLVHDFPKGVVVFAGVPVQKPFQRDPSAVYLPVQFEEHLLSFFGAFSIAIPRFDGRVPSFHVAFAVVRSVEARLSYATSARHPGPSLPHFHQVREVLPFHQSLQCGCVGIFFQHHACARFHRRKWRSAPSINIRPSLPAKSQPCSSLDPPSRSRRSQLCSLIRPKSRSRRSQRRSLIHPSSRSFDSQLRLADESDPHGEITTVFL